MVEYHTSRYRTAAGVVFLNSSRGDLSIGAFSLVIPGILLAVMSDDPLETVRQLAVPLVLVGSTVMVIGILL